jgi:biopolymer transport protein ExbD
MRLGEPGERRRNPTLLPLVDVIFLLLIFFMFSSNLSPFALLQLTRDRTGTAGAPEAAAAVPATLSARDVDVMLLVGAAGAIRVNGEEVAGDVLRPFLTELHRRGAENLVIVPTAGATVQDLVSALEAARRSGIAFVAIRQ